MVKKKNTSAPVTFTFTDGRTRTFSQADHGDDFLKIADEFEETHKEGIKSRYQEETEEVEESADESNG